jgi:thiol-disulfide isomerase/thioredoxin
MRYLFCAIFVLIVALPCFTQHTINGSILGHYQQNITLLEYFGDKHSFADSTMTDENGGFSFTMDENAPSGLYSLAVGSNPLFNFIYNDEDISLKFDLGEYELPEFIFSIENLIYYDYLVQSDKYDQKTGLLIDILQYYPSKDSFYLFTEDHFQRVQKEFSLYTNRIIKEYPNSIASHIVRSDRPVMIPVGFNWNEYLLFNQSHFLDETDFNDTILLNTNIFSGKAIDYLALYSTNKMSKEMQEHFFIQAVDTILHKSMVNGRVYDFLMQYLIEGFDMYGFDKVISHIAENYEPANSCVNEDRKSELQKRMENLRKLAVGNQAPQIEITNINGNKFQIENIESELVLILFWASWCPHCNAMIPGLKELYEDQALTDFEVLAISIDTSATDYGIALAEHATGWINYSELKGWDSKAIIDYSIYATPTMFLLNRDRNIIARPTSIIDLKNALINLQR